MLQLYCYKNIDFEILDKIFANEDRVRNYIPSIVNYYLSFNRKQNSRKPECILFTTVLHDLTLPGQKFFSILLYFFTEIPLIVALQVVLLQFKIYHII